MDLTDKKEIIKKFNETAELFRNALKFSITFKTTTTTVIETEHITIEGPKNKKIDFTRYNT